MATIVKPKPKKARTFWYQLPSQPKCPKCGDVCLVVSSQPGETLNTQYRKCPKCGYTMTTHVERP